MIFKMARGRTDDGRDVKTGAVINDNNGRLITESKEVLRIWAANFKELQVDRNSFERVYAGGKDTEGVEDGPDSVDMEEERGCA